tara:strand:+ start:973 stop:1254 length:282 start_codon:yes stop_codon:yes gene_type:complete
MPSVQLHSIEWHERQLRQIEEEEKRDRLIRETVGRAVTITGLKNSQEHNNKRAIIHSYDPSKDRYIVRMTEGVVSSMWLSVKSNNMTLGWRYH